MRREDICSVNWDLWKQRFGGTFCVCAFVKVCRKDTARTQGFLLNPATLLSKREL